MPSTLMLEGWTKDLFLHPLLPYLHVPDTMNTVASGGVFILGGIPPLPPPEMPFFGDLEDKKQISSLWLKFLPGSGQ